MCELDNVVSTLFNCLDPLVPIFSNHQKKDLHTFGSSYLPILCVSCGHNTRAKHYVGTFYPLGSPNTKCGCEHKLAHSICCC